MIGSLIRVPQSLLTMKRRVEVKAVPRIRIARRLKGGELAGAGPLGVDDDRLDGIDLTNGGGDALGQLVPAERSGGIGRFVVRLIGQHLRVVFVAPGDFPPRRTPPLLGLLAFPKALAVHIRAERPMEVENTVHVILAAPAEELVDSGETLLRVFSRVHEVLDAALLDAAAERGHAHPRRQRDVLLLHMDQRPIAAALSRVRATAPAIPRPELPMHAANGRHGMKHARGRCGAFRSHRAAGRSRRLLVENRRHGCRPPPIRRSSPGKATTAIPEPAARPRLRKSCGRTKAS